MKTYLPNIERRIYVRPNQTFGILNYDLDNAYPQRMVELVGQSPTAKSCWGTRAKYIGGNGFEAVIGQDAKGQDISLGAYVVNGKGNTMAQLLKAVATDKALFTGFGIHVNYNANYQIINVHYVRFEDIRMGDIDEAEYRGKFVLYPDWGRRSWKSIYRSKLTILDPFNPSPAVIREQVIAAGGWDKYKGQLYYFNPEVDDYPLIEADEVWEDFETEAGIKVFNNRSVTTGFMPSTIISMRARREQADMQQPNSDQGIFYNNRLTKMDNDFATFQSAKESQKIMVIEYDDPESKPEVTPYSIQNNDKLFTTTEQSVERRIIKGFKIPKELINSEKSSGLSNGGEKKEAIREFNDLTKPDRTEISQAFYTIFSNWFEPIGNDDNWNIIPIPDNVADLNGGGKVGTSLNQLLLTDMPRDNKIAQLKYVYGFNQQEAEEMAPLPGSFTPVNLKLPGSTPEPTPQSETEGETK